jgi:hypothetical protein
MTRLSTATPLPTPRRRAILALQKFAARLRTLKGAVKDKLRMESIRFSVVKQRYGFSSAPGITFLSGEESCCSSSGWGMGLRGNI